MTKITTLPIDAISRDPDQPRTDFDSPDALTAAAALEYSIGNTGILQPLLVRQDFGNPGQYIVVDGERRLRAAKANGLTEVPVYVREFEEAGKRLAAQLFANLARRDLTQDEVSKSIADLRKLGYKGAEIAEKLDKTAGWVSKQERYATDPLAIDLRKEGLLNSPHTYAELKGNPEPVQQAVIDHHKAAGTPISRTTISQVSRQLKAAGTPISRTTTSEVSRQLKSFDIDSVLSGIGKIQAEQIAADQTFVCKNQDGIEPPAPIQAPPASPTSRPRKVTVGRERLLSYLQAHPEIETLTVEIGNDDLDGLGGLE